LDGQNSLPSHAPNPISSAGLSLWGYQMTYDRRVLFEPQHKAELASRKLRSDHLILTELTKALAPHPGGLRRWSVMRAIRNDRECNGHDIPQNFEVEVERMFRRFCAIVDAAKRGGGSWKEALFFRPAEKAGEVWAILQGIAPCPGAISSVSR
jgi:hypothetical protein